MDHLQHNQPPAAPGTTAPAAAAAPFKLLVADEDEALFAALVAALAPLRFDGRTVQPISARSIKQTRTLLQPQDHALLLIHTDLEAPEGGLRLVEQIRPKYGRHLRILLLADAMDEDFERLALERYGVDACLDRRTPTGNPLVVAVLRSLRIHADLMVQESSRQAMSRVMVATGGLFEAHTSHVFYFNCLLQLCGLLEIGRHALMCVRGDNIPTDGVIRIRAGGGRFSALRDIPLAMLEDAGIRTTIERAFELSGAMQGERSFTLTLRSRFEVTAVIFIEGSRLLSATDHQMLEIFRNKAGIALSSLVLVNELNAAQKAIVLALAQVAEHKDNVAPGHLQRIERLSEETARELYRRGAFPEELTGVMVERIGLASILHDAGMICVPDKVMFSTEQLLAEDYKVIRHHPTVGWDILNKAATLLRGESVLSMAAEIARSHHERFDGGGYPAGLCGNDIPLAGRIVAVVDVFDALMTDRSHRLAWGLEETRRWIAEQSGRHFDPQVVEAFFTVIDRMAETDPGSLPTDPRAERDGRSAGGGLRALAGWFGPRLGSRAKDTPVT